MDSKPSCLLRGTTCRDLFATKPALAFQSTCPLRGTTRYPCCTLSNRGILFQSTCPLRGTTYRKNGIDGWILFQSTCPLRGTTVPLEPCGCLSAYFNPRAPCGARLVHQRCTCQVLAHFNPRAPCGARPCRGRIAYAFGIFQSTCPLRGTTKKRKHNARKNAISIHVPLAGHDTITFASGTSARIFQSTCPLRGTTVPDVIFFYRPDYFNPRAPCGARRAKPNYVHTLN